MTTQSDLDRAIDAAARDLTTGDPPANLCARVLARLDERPARWRWMPAAACAAVVVAAAVMTFQHRQDSPVADQAKASQPKPSAHEAQADRASVADQPAALVPDSRPDPRTQEPGVRATAPSAELVAWQARAVPALDLPDRPTLDDIQPAPLDVRPLDTEPLTVPALDEDETGAVENR